MRKTSPKPSSESYIKENLPPILVPLANAVLFEKPSNPVSRFPLPHRLFT